MSVLAQRCKLDTGTHVHVPLDMQWEGAAVVHVATLWSTGCASKLRPHLSDLTSLHLLSRVDLAMVLWSACLLLLRRMQTASKFYASSDV